jgi:hypothetical protein
MLRLGQLPGTASLDCFLGLLPGTASWAFLRLLPGTASMNCFLVCCLRLLHGIMSLLGCVAASSAFLVKSMALLLPDIRRGLGSAGVTTSEPSWVVAVSALSGSPQPLTSLCRCCGVSLTAQDDQRGQALTFRASLREKALSQLPQGKGLTLRWILVCRFRSWLRLKLWGHCWHL